MIRCKVIEGRRNNVSKSWSGSANLGQRRLTFADPLQRAHLGSIFHGVDGEVDLGERLLLLYRADGIVDLADALLILGDGRLGIGGRAIGVHFEDGAGRAVYGASCGKRGRPIVSRKRAAVLGGKRGKEPTRLARGSGDGPGRGRR